MRTCLGYWQRRLPGSSHSCILKNWRPCHCDAGTVIQWVHGFAGSSCSVPTVQGRHVDVWSGVDQCAYMEATPQTGSCMYVAPEACPQPLMSFPSL